MNNNPETVVLMKQTVGTQTILSCLDKGEYPTFIPENAEGGQVNWADVRRVDFTMSSENIDDIYKKIQSLWDVNTDALFTFRGGTMGMPSTAQIIGCSSGTYEDPQGATRPYLRVYLECDPVLLGNTQPPEMV